MTINIEDIFPEIVSGRVREFKHKDFETLSGFNYTESCQYSAMWNDININCRGIIFDNNVCIARPFKKFFNIEELKNDISMETTKLIQLKEDGSLIISFVYNNEIHFSTRGSFHSDQAISSKKIWEYIYSKKDSKYNTIDFFKKHTFLFELVGPSNINVTRGYLKDDLILLSVCKIDSGNELDYHLVDDIAKSFDITRPKTFNTNTVSGLYQWIKDNKDPNFEGVVITLNDESKVKIKSHLYVQLHKAISGVLGRDSKYELWLESRQNDSNSILNTLKVPDEFFKDVRKEISIIEDHYSAYEEYVKNTLDAMFDDFKLGFTRKELALKWSEKWLLNYIFSRNGNLNDMIMKNFKKKYMDGEYE